jgi:hypothetical protein
VVSTGARIVVVTLGLIGLVLAAPLGRTLVVGAGIAVVTGQDFACNAAPVHASVVQGARVTVATRHLDKLMITSPRWKADVPCARVFIITLQ